MQLTFFFQNNRNKKAYCAYVTMSRFEVYIRMGACNIRRTVARKVASILGKRFFLNINKKARCYPRFLTSLLGLV